MNRQALVVLGMHRGGTSAVAGFVVRLGVQSPKTLMPPDPNNPAGYWESSVFYELHERLLRVAGSRWDAFTRLDPEQLRSAMPASLSGEYRSALQAEFGSAPRFVLKDPRMCRLVPFWLEMLREECISPAAILVLRSPADVARSLAARNGFEHDFSLLVWLRHMLDAEHDTRAVPRTFVRYQDLVESWATVGKRISHDLEIRWPPRSAVDDAEIDRFVSSQLQHHHGDSDLTDVTAALADWTRLAWAALEQLHDNHGTRTGQAFAALDAIWAELNRHTSVLADVRDRIQERLRARIDHLEREQRALTHHAAVLEAQRDTLERQRDALQSQIEVLQREGGALKQELAAAQANVEALHQSASWRMTAPLRAMYRMLR